MAEHVWADSFPASAAKDIAAAALSRSFNFGMIFDAWEIAEYALLQVKPKVQGAGPMAEFLELEPPELRVDSDVVFEALGEFAEKREQGRFGALPLSWIAVFWAIYDLVGTLRK